MHRRTVLRLAVGLVSLVATKPCVGQTPDTAAAASLVAQFTGEAIEALSASGVTVEQRARALREIITRYSGGRLLSEGILGRSWAAASEEQRARFHGSLAEYLSTLCASVAADMPPGTRVLVTGAEPEGGRVVVHSTVITGADGRVPLDWLISTTADGRPIMSDVSSGGVSLIRTVRSDFSAVLFASGGNLDSLIAAISQKTKLALE